jgi:uroporphyrin-III C-methyltransferase
MTAPILQTETRLEPLPTRQAETHTPALAAPSVAAVQAAGWVLSRPLFLTAALSVVVALVLSVWLWIKLSNIQEHLARQSADSGVAAQEARANAKGAQELSRETAAKQALMENKLSEVVLQRGQLEALMQSLARSRDENLVVDVESSLRLAQQQAQLSGSVEPLLAALKSGEQRIGRAAQPRLNPLQRTLAKDFERVKAAAVIDVPSVLQKLDDLVRQVDALELANGHKSSGADTKANTASSQATLTKVTQSGGTMTEKNSTETPPSANWWLWFWQKWIKASLDDLRDLVRVSRIDQPDAVLLTPEHSFFLRENIKLKLLNARLAVLSRQFELARSESADVSQALTRYFDQSKRSTQNATHLLQQAQLQMKNVNFPRIDESLTALATAAR